jgi:hypothetical protein
VAIAQGLGKIQIIDGKEMFDNPFRSDKKKGKNGLKTLSLTNRFESQERENDVSC